jgi:hypothetical protein
LIGDHLQRQAARDRDGELQRVGFAGIKIARQYGLDDRSTVTQRRNLRVDAVAQKNSSVGTVIRFGRGLDRLRADTHRGNHGLRHGGSSSSENAAGYRRHCD